MQNVACACRPSAKHTRAAEVAVLEVPARPVHRPCTMGRSSLPRGTDADVTASVSATTGTSPGGDANCKLMSKAGAVARLPMDVSFVNSVSRASKGAQLMPQLAAQQLQQSRQVMGSVLDFSKGSVPHCCNEKKDVCQF